MAYQLVELWAKNPEEEVRILTSGGFTHQITAISNHLPVYDTPQFAYILLNVPQCGKIPFRFCTAVFTVF